MYFLKRNSKNSTSSPDEDWSGNLVLSSRNIILVPRFDVSNRLWRDKIYANLGTGHYAYHRRGGGGGADDLTCITTKFTCSVLCSILRIFLNFQ